MLRLAFAMCMCMVCAVAKPQPCAVTQHLIPDAVVGTIALGGGSIALTVPDFDFGLENMLLTLETRGIEKDPNLKLLAGEESVAIEDGAVLHVRRKPGERLAFSVVRHEEVECLWEPQLAADARTRARLDTEHLDFRLHNFFVFPIGEPIFLVLVHPMEQTPREVALGGLPARVLAETPYLVILRDPAPAIGTRVVETGGQSAELHFAEIERELVVTSGTSARLEIRGKEIPRGHWRLLLWNMSPERFTLGKGCGRVRKGKDGAEGAGRDVFTQEFRMSCEIRSKGPFPVDPGMMSLLLIRASLPFSPIPRLTRR